MSVITKCTYNPEDNKLRVYTTDRVERELYLKFREHGFVYAKIQKLFVAPMWTPAREDFCVSLTGEIVADEITLVERAEAKSERLENLAQKRNSEANGYARVAREIRENLNSGQPIIVGHHSERKALREKGKLDKAVEQHEAKRSAVSYWIQRAQGVECHANRKVDSFVRAGRIKTLLADLRGHQRSLNHGHYVQFLWKSIKKGKEEAAAEYYSGARVKDGALSPTGVYDDFRKGKLTAQEVINKSIEFGVKLANREYNIRFIEHILNRLAYEQSELGYEVVPHNGKLTAAKIQTFLRTHGADSPKASKTENGWLVKAPLPLPVQIGDGREMELSEDDWKQLMCELGYEVPAPAPKKPPLLNLNVQAVKVKKLYSENAEVYPVVKMTKEEYSKIHSDQKGVKASFCGKFRVKVVIAGVFDTCEHRRKVVFLTNSKVHSTPDSDSVVIES